MGADIYVERHLKLASGKLYNVGTVPCPYLINNELWFQTECRFIMDWAPGALTRVHPDECDDPTSKYGEFYITPAAAHKLMAKLNKALTYEYDPGRKKKLEKLLPWLDPDDLNPGKIHYLFRDMSVAVESLSVLMQYDGDIDSVFILTIS